MNCSICDKNNLDDSMFQYYSPVCNKCDEKAINKNGTEALHTIQKEENLSLDELISIDDGDNPVYIDGKKCWRRYKFGSWITMLDKFNCNTIHEFYLKNKINN